MPNPNEVMDVEQQAANLLKGDYACTRVWEAWEVGTMTADDFEPLEETERPAEIARLIAQQNAALLRSLLKRKRVTGQIGENGYRVDTEWIPASIVEAKAEELEKSL